MESYHGFHESAIKEYVFDNKEIRATLNDLKIYQKVVLHPMSHVGGEKVNYTIKELRMTLSLLQKFDQLIEQLMKPKELTRI